MSLRDKVVHHLGALDDETIAKVLATGASEAEIAEAAHWIRGDLEDMESDRGEPSSSKVRDVIYVVSRSEDDEDTDQ